MILKKEFITIEENLAFFDIKNSKISSSKIAWHLDHIIKVINESFKAYKNSKPQNFVKKFNKYKFVIYLINRFPRGKAKAPKEVDSKNEIELQQLKKDIFWAKENINSIDSLDKKLYFKHPIFGHLDKKEYLKFLKIHTNHHLKIIKDILKT